MDTIFLTLLSLCLPASILIIIAILFRFVFKKAPKWLMGVMWTIVALRLIIPFQVESSIGFLPNIGNRLEAFFIGNNESDSIVYVVEDNNEFFSSEIITHEYTPNAVAPNEPDDVVHDYLPNETITVTPNNNDIPEVVTGRREMMIRLQMIWLFGVLVMLAYAVFSYVSIRKKIRTSIKLNSYDNVFECDEISTPFILGIFKPTIYIPSGLDENTVKNVLAHENSHIKRLDHIRKQLGFLLLAVYWFNPLVWIA
ncbi:BlaR1 peptidase M56, partial [Butyrivibrio sp. YAB3001]